MSNISSRISMRIGIVKISRISVCLFMLVSLGLLTSCTMAQQHRMAGELVQADMNKLSVGMTKAEVRKTIGSVFYRHDINGTEAWVYYYSFSGKTFSWAGMAGSKTCLTVVFGGNRTIGWLGECPPGTSKTKNVYRVQDDKVYVGIEESRWLVSFSPGSLKNAPGTMTGYFTWQQGPAVLSILIEPASKGTDAIFYRNRSLGRIKEADRDSQGYKSWENGESAFSAYVSHRGGQKRRHLNRHIVKDGFWYDMHYSKSYSGDEDESKALAYLRSFKLVHASVITSPPLLDATLQSDIGRIDAMLKSGENINGFGGKFGDTPLMAASRQGNLDIVKLLVSRGAGINSRGAYGDTPLASAAWTRQDEIMKYLLDKGADVNNRNDYKWTPLHYAASRGYAESSRLLIDKGADVKARDQYDRTPLHYAAGAGKIEVVRILIEKSADVNAKGDKQQTPLHEAAFKGHAEVAKLLIDRGADVNARDNQQMTALLVAEKKGHSATVEMLKTVQKKVMP